MYLPMVIGVVKSKAVPFTDSVAPVTSRFSSARFAL